MARQFSGMHNPMAPTEYDGQTVLMSAPPAPEVTDQNIPSGSDGVNFTFVNQADDLVSLCRRRISNKEQRHTIRSHVMQRVRQTEIAQGKKRLTGRENSQRSARTKSKSKSAEATSPVSKGSPESTIAGSVSDGKRNKLSVSRSPPRSPSLTISPGANEFDPFDTLPTNNLSRQASQSILQYCECFGVSFQRSTIDSSRLRCHAAHDLLCREPERARQDRPTGHGLEQQSLKSCNLPRLPRHLRRASCRMAWTTQRSWSVT
jgi:hypothetical protein